MLKTAQYPNWGWPVVGMEFGKVAYIILGDHCYYSGLQRSYGPGKNLATSTINAADSIITDILQHEKRKWNDLIFFDIQTTRGYLYPSGLYTMDRLELVPAEHWEFEFHVGNWVHDVECPKEVEQIFKELIGKIEMEIWNPEEARKRGYEPSTHHSRTNGYWVQEIQREKELAEMLYKASARRTPASLLLGHQPEKCILVDHKGYSTYLKISEGERYCIWRRVLLRDN